MKKRDAFFSDELQLPTLSERNAHHIISLGLPLSGIVVKIERDLLHL
jgi:hypothetical protein